MENQDKGKGKGKGKGISSGEIQSSAADIVVNIGDSSVGTTNTASNIHYEKCSFYPTSDRTPNSQDIARDAADINKTKDNFVDIPEHVRISWIKQNIFLYTFVKTLSSKMSPFSDQQTTYRLSLTEIIDRLKANSSEMHEDALVKIEELKKLVTAWPHGNDVDVRWGEVTKLTQDVANRFDASHIFNQGFNVKYARGKTVGWVDRHHLKCCYKDDHVTKNIISKLTQAKPSTDTVSKTKGKQRYPPHGRHSPFIPRLHLEQAVSNSINDPSARLVYLYGKLGCGKTSLVRSCLKDDAEHFPINFPDVLPDEDPDIVLERFAQDFLDKCGVLPQMSDDLERPTNHLLNFLQSQGTKTYILDPIDDVLRTNDTARSLLEYLDVLHNNGSINISLILVSSMSEDDLFERSNAHFSIPVFTEEESRKFLTEFFAPKTSSDLFHDFTFDTIAHHLGHNPKALNIVANAMKNRMRFLGTMKMKKNIFLSMLGTKDIRGKVELDEIIQKRIESLDKNTKVILEAISLYSQDFSPRMILELLDIEQVYSCLLLNSTVTTDFDDDLQKDREMVRQRAQNDAYAMAKSLQYSDEFEMQNVCIDALRQLERLTMVEMVDEDHFILDPYTRKIAFRVFANNPFKFLKLHFGRIQIQKMLTQSSDESPPKCSDLRQIVAMILNLYPRDEPSHILNYSNDELLQIFENLLFQTLDVVNRFEKNQVLYSPEEYFSVCDKLSKAIPQSVEIIESIPRKSSSITESDSPSSSSLSSPLPITDSDSPSSLSSSPITAPDSSSLSKSRYNPGKQ